MGSLSKLRASIETHYMGPVVDAPASDALAQLLAGNLPAMSDAKKRAWARFLMSLALRNPETLVLTSAAGAREYFVGGPC